MPVPLSTSSNGEGYAITNEEDFHKKDEELDRESQKVAPIPWLSKDSANSSASRPPTPSGNSWSPGMSRTSTSVPHAAARKLKAIRSTYRKPATTCRWSRTLPARTASFCVPAHPRHNARRGPGVSGIEPRVDGRRLPHATFSGWLVQDTVLGSLCLRWHDQDVCLSCIAARPETSSATLRRRTGKPVVPKIMPELPRSSVTMPDARSGTRLHHPPDFLNAVELDEVCWLVKTKRWYDDSPREG